MATLKEEQERIRSLLLDTVTLLCKNGLTFRKQLKVQGLLGITLDEDNVFIVHFDENLGEVTVEAADKCPSSTSENDTVKNTPRERRTDRKRKAMVDVSEEPEEKIHIKSESNDDVVFLEDQPDVKPVHIQALPSFQSEAMYTNYAQLPLNQPPQVIPNVMNSNVPTTFSPGTLHSPSNLQPHGAMAFPDPSATIPQQMTPEKFASSSLRLLPISSYRDRFAHNSKTFMCTYPGCGRSYYQRSTVGRHIKMKHPEVTKVSTCIKARDNVDENSSRSDAAYLRYLDNTIGEQDKALQNTSNANLHRDSLSAFFENLNKDPECGLPEAEPMQDAPTSNGYGTSEWIYQGGELQSVENSVAQAEKISVSNDSLG